MNTTRRSPLSKLKTTYCRLIGWLMLLTLITGIRAKDSLKTLKDRLENNRWTGCPSICTPFGLRNFKTSH